VPKKPFKSTKTKKASPKARNTDNADVKQKPHLFQPGQSGNPKGKPRGLRNHATRLAERLLDGQTEALVQKAVDMALGGDVTALRLCLERLCAPRKSRPINIKLPEVKMAEGISDAQGAVVSAVADGQITPEEGSVLSGILEVRRKTIETEEHEKRISDLEARHGKG